MAITLVGSSHIEDNNSSSTVSVPAHADGDLGLLFFQCNDYDITPSVTGWTLLRRDWIDSGAKTYSSAVLYKRLGASEPANITVNYDYHGTAYQGNSFMVYRGVDVTTPFDATTTFLYSAAAANANHPDITTVTDGSALVLMWAAPTDDATTQGIPSTPSGIVQVEGNTYQIIAHLLDAGSSGAKSIGAWSNTGTTASSSSEMYTVALRPAAVAASGQTMKIGSTSIGAVYSGSTAITRVYSGSTLVHGDAP